MNVAARLGPACAVLLAGLALALGAGEAEVRVSFVTGSSVYVDAGSEDGLRAGDELQVVRDGQVVAVLRVKFVSSHRAACAREGDTAVTLAIGDLVRFTPRRAAAAGAGDAAQAAPTPTPPRRPVAQRLRELGLRGRVGLRYSILRDRSGTGLTTSQPALDLRLDGRRVGGSPFDVNADIRTQRTYRTVAGADTTQSRNRVYRLSAAWQPAGSRLRLSAGRQFSPSLAAISIFDGVLAEHTGERWTLGVFSGTQPDPVDFGTSSAVREHGAFTELRSSAGAARRWAVTAGAIGSYENGEINREFAYLQGRYDDRRWSAYLTQEIDQNRGWKEQAGESRFSPTSTFAMLRYRAGAGVTLRAGYDNRRNVRLYRDRVTPETEFDDSYRRGVWLGSDFEFGPRLRAGLEARTNAGGDAGGADSYSVNLGVRELTSWRIGARTRSTRYSNERVEGWLHSLTIGRPLGQRANVGLTAGVRDETARREGVLAGRVSWYGLDFDVLLGRRWFFLLSAERTSGDTEDNDQAYTALSYRF
ncbi:MAG: hypothetical protein KBD01_18455 [Acidobacteria bacterium]|nr:hypothetical protein [Acidobacteriota bacterium]